ncbi:MAG: hypothetical protein RIF32_09835 [Leptospirales bacterium]|jgi:hypothetical protein
MATYDFSKIDIIGAALQSFFGGLGAFQSIADRILGELQYGSRRDDGTYFFEPERWYPAGPNIRMFELLKEKVGASTLKQAGRSVPENAIFPPGVDTIQKGLASIDVAYHLNHGQNGKPLMDPATGQIQDIIGQYRVEETPGQNEAHVTSDTPYPSEFDEGIVSAMARRFEPGARVHLDTSRPNRLNGGDSCTYIVRW